jgi:hypothetical protein
LGLPTQYCEPEVRRERANGREDTVRQWHVDPEDHRMFKVIIWLDDVSLAGGAFEWLPRRYTDETARKLNYVTGFVSDKEMERVMPRRLWRSAPGPRWTAVLGDTRSIFTGPEYPKTKIVTPSPTAEPRVGPLSRFRSIPSVPRRRRPFDEASAHGNGPLCQNRSDEHGFDALRRAAHASDFVSPSGRRIRH